MKTDTVPLIPEWWQTRIGSDRPQLVVVFKLKNESNNGKNKANRWSLTIPHFDGSGTQTNIQKKLKLIPDYDKGNYQGMLTLKYNSKLIIYAKSIIEAERFIKKIVTSNLIDKKYLDKANYDIKVGKIKGNFKEIRVTPTYAKYYSTGQKNLGLPNLLCKTYKDFLTRTRRSQNKSYTRLDFCRKTWLIIIYIE